MTKPMILAVLAVLALAITLTSIVSAQQPQLPHLFIGSADGAEVTAWVDGAQVASATIANGAYTITVDPGTDSWGGKTVSFQIDGTDAAETATFVHGGADEINLTASSNIPTSISAIVATAWSGLSQYLVDDQGMSLYLFTVDTHGTDTTAPEAKCTSAGCVGAWPPLWTTGDPIAKEQPEFAGGADAEFLGTLEWEDGNIQVTYHGWPLYHYFKDLVPGDVTGQYGPWYLVAPAGTLLVGGTNVDPAGPPEDGTDGADGTDGRRGASGSKGDTGDTGAAGAAGRAGAAGAAGADGSDGSGGSAGSAGPAGAAGAAGTDGDDGSSMLAIVALILAIISLLGAGGVFFLRRGT